MNKAFYQNKTVLITGGGGSIGSELCLQLLNFKVSKIVVLDHSELALHNLEINLRGRENCKNVEFILADIRNKRHLESVFKRKKPNIVFHAAALKQLPLLERFPSEAVLTNIYGTQNLTALAAQHKTDNFIFISTDKAVEPSSVMGATKQIAEHYINSIGKIHVKYAIVRFGNVYNSNGSAIELFKSQIKSGGPVTITDPNIERYFISIKNACQRIIEICSISKGQETFIIDMGSPKKISDIINDLIIELNPKNKIKMESVGLRPGEKLKEILVDPNVNLMKSEIDKISYFVQDRKSLDIEKFELLLKDALNRNDKRTLKGLKELSDLN